MKSNANIYIFFSPSYWHDCVSCRRLQSGWKSNCVCNEVEILENAKLEMQHSRIFNCVARFNILIILMNSTEISAESLRFLIAVPSLTIQYIFYTHCVRGSVGVFQFNIQTFHVVGKLCAHFCCYYCHNEILDTDSVYDPLFSHISV